MIYNTITKVGSITREFKKATTDNTVKENELKVKLSNNKRDTKEILINNQIDNLQLDLNLELKKISIKQECSKGTILLFYSVISSILSAIFSICGLNNVKYVNDVFKDIPSTSIALLFIFFAILNMIVSYYSTFTKKNYYDISCKWKLFQVTFIFTSIISNIIFLNMQGINLALSTILAILLDMSSVLAIENYNCRKYKNKSYSDEKKQDVFTMIYTIMTYDLLQKITLKYNQIIGANETQKILIKPNDWDSWDNDEKSVPSTKKFINNGAKKISKEEYLKMIESLAPGTQITPKSMNMESNRTTFYRYSENCDMVEKINGRYIRV